MSIFLLAWVFTLAIIFLIKHPDLLQASVLNAWELSLIKENKRDIAYKQSEWIIDIFFSSLIADRKINLIFAHNPLIYLDIPNFSGQCEHKIIQSNQDNTNIEIYCTKLADDQSVLIIPFVWKSQDILIEEWYYFDNNVKKNLSIWNISESTEHSK